MKGAVLDIKAGDVDSPLRYASLTDLLPEARSAALLKRLKFQVFLRKEWNGDRQLVSTLLVYWVDNLSWVMG